jgi:hypothetical protein
MNYGFLTLQISSVNRSPKRYAAITACVGVVTFSARGTADVWALTVFSVSANLLARSALKNQM